MLCRPGLVRKPLLCDGVDVDIMRMFLRVHVHAEWGACLRPLDHYLKGKLSAGKAKPCLDRFRFTRLQFLPFFCSTAEKRNRLPVLAGTGRATSRCLQPGQRGARIATFARGVMQLTIPVLRRPGCKQRLVVLLFLAFSGNRSPTKQGLIAL